MAGSFGETRELTVRLYLLLRKENKFIQVFSNSLLRLNTSLSIPKSPQACALLTHPDPVTVQSSFRVENSPSELP